MSKRLQVLVSEEEAEEFRRSAAREGATLSDWARRAMRHFQQRHAHRSEEQKLAALERALQKGHPTGDIDGLLGEIETGRDLR